MTERLSDIQERIESVKQNYKIISERIAEAAIKSGRNPSDVKFMAVTKTVDPVFINAAIDEGITLIGENRVQEFLSKEPELKLEGVEKHLIGHLQKNKVRQIVGKVDMIESVDSVELAKEISKRSEMLGINTDVLIEVNIGEEDSKFGIDKSKLEEFLGEISLLPAISVKGLMCIPPICEKSEEVRAFFSQMNQLFIDFSPKIFNNINMNVLSMGMSSDYYEAILEGSNLVRVGSSLFGPRIYR